jgi:hypothetical protein
MFTDVQIGDRDDVGIGFAGLWFWRDGFTYALGTETNGWTNLSEQASGFVCPAEGRYALNNGEEKGFVFTAFQVLQVKPIERYEVCMRVLCVDVSMCCRGCTTVECSMYDICTVSVCTIDSVCVYACTCIFLVFNVCMHTSPDASLSIEPFSFPMNVFSISKKSDSV